MEKWFLVDSKKGDLFTKVLSAKNSSDAIQEATTIWNSLSAFDRKQRDAFFVIYAEENEEGQPDYDLALICIDLIDQFGNMVIATL